MQLISLKVEQFTCNSIQSPKLNLKEMVTSIKTISVSFDQLGTILNLLRFELQ